VSVSGDYVPLVGDYNGDGKSDIFWYGPGAAQDALWSGTSTRGTFLDGVSVRVNGNYEPF
jgi:hypothetical protein